MDVFARQQQLREELKNDNLQKVAEMEEQLTFSGRDIGNALFRAALGQGGWLVFVLFTMLAGYVVAGGVFLLVLLLIILHDAKDILAEYVKERVTRLLRQMLDDERLEVRITRKALVKIGSTDFIREGFFDGWNAAINLLWADLAGEEFRLPNGWKMPGPVGVSDYARKELRNSASMIHVRLCDFKAAARLEQEKIA